MNQENLVLEINTAIAYHLKTKLIVKNANGKTLEFDFYPMVYGEDFFEHKFVWGMFLPFTYYMFRFSDIISIEHLEGKFEGTPKNFYYQAKPEIYAAYDDVLINDIMGPLDTK
jgi:hypothetical protein